MGLAAAPTVGAARPADAEVDARAERCVRDDLDDAGAALFKGVDEKTVVWMSHGDKVTALPEGFRTLASSETCAHAAVGDDARRFYLAGKDALRSEHILSVQRHLYCAHPMSFVLRPIFDTTFEMVTLKVREASFDA